MKLALKLVKASIIVGASVVFVTTSVVVGTVVRTAIDSMKCGRST
jgi:hypothetical protein